MRLRGLGLLVPLAISSVIGCTRGPDGNGTNQPLVFPWEGQLGATGWGTTTAIVLDSNYQDPYDSPQAPSAQAPGELYSLDKDRVTVAVINAGSSAQANVRAVFSVQAPPTSVIPLVRPGAWVTAVLLDLPKKDDLGVPTFIAPFNVTLQVAIDGVPNPRFAPQMKITGLNGIPNPILQTTGLTGLPSGDPNSYLDTQTLIRLRGKRDQTGTETWKFRPESWSLIAGIEFDFRYSTQCIWGFSVRAYPGSEATNATGTVSFATMPSPGIKEVHVTLVDANGFSLITPANYQSGYGATTWRAGLAGTGPFLDLGVDKYVNCDLRLSANAPTPDYFSIHNLRVVDINGQSLLEVPGEVTLDRDGTAVPGASLRYYVINRTPPAAPGPGGGC